MQTHLGLLVQGHHDKLRRQVYEELNLTINQEFPVSLQWRLDGDLSFERRLALMADRCL